MNDKLELTTKLRFRDALRFNFYIAYNTKINIIFSIVSAISLGVFVFNMINSNQPLDNAFTSNFGLLVAPFVFFVIIPVRVLRVTKNLIGTKVLDQEAKYIFSLKNVEIETVDGSADIPWSNYVKVKETSSDFRFFLDKVQAQLIPKYNLTKKEIEDLRAIVKKSVKEDVARVK